MHSYLKSIGFSKINNQELDNLIYEATRKPDGHEVAIDSEGNEFVELNLEVCKNTGIAIRGNYDREDNFRMDYYYPYCKSDCFSSDAELEIIKQSDKESYQGFCDETRLGVNLIFYLQNVMEYLQKSSGRKNERFHKAYMTGLALEGKILLPVAEPIYKSANVKEEERSNLVAAARDGDEEAIEQLTLDDMETYSMISRRMMNEDIYSIVVSTFMPYGIESDKYTVIGEIEEISTSCNAITLEQLYKLRISCNGLEFDVCINAKDLLGEPKVGRRFKGNIWMQGSVEF